MTFLLEQDIIQPPSQYSIPRRGFSPKNNHPKGSCPRCGDVKADRLKVCVKCKLETARSPVDPNIYLIDDEPCRRLPLRHGLYTFVDADLYEYLMQWPWRAYYDSSARPWGVHATIRVNGKRKTLKMHHLIHESDCPRRDHRNRNPLDNRRSNLRNCTAGQSTYNRGKARVNTTGYKGVCVVRRYSRFVASISAEGKHIALGTHKDKIHAARIYDAAALICHGEFASLNFPNEPTVELPEKLLRKLQMKLKISQNPVDLQCS
jgi:hypothetical protein